MSLKEERENNLVREKKLAESLSSKLKKQVSVQKARRLWLSIEAKEIVDICSTAVQMGFEHLSTISVTDWLKEKVFELTYHLWSYKDNMLLTVKTRIDRDNPVISSVNSIWSTNAEVCERECHEFFGVSFEGNSNLTPLMLEDWDGPPPFRKDFDWRGYVQEEYYDNSDPREENYFEVKK